MPRIFDNIDLPILTALKDTLRLSDRADFCVGYFNLRGWRKIDALVDSWSGGLDSCCRLLVGMQGSPHEQLRDALSLSRDDDGIDQRQAVQLRRRMAEQFKEQLTLGAPTNEDEAGLRRLSAQIKAKKLVVKLFLRHLLHAKLYLMYREDPNNPVTGLLGSSNLTLAGLCKQGELNVDVLEHDACEKLQKWFEERWIDRWCLDISDELVQIIDTSWAREEAIPPYHIYLKIAYHLSQEARDGLSEFPIPADLADILFPFQTAAVKIAAHHVNKRGGVLIGDVVGLGKTLMATALVRVLEETDDGLSTLVICPRNLVRMWQSYIDGFGLKAKVVPMSMVARELPNTPARFRRVLIDESHNLRNKEGARYKLIQEYIRQTDSKCILLSATPYNKAYADLSSQIALFTPEDRDIGIRPEHMLRELGEAAFKQKHQCPVRSLAAFEQSLYADDWRELMRLFLIRRTRGFIQDNYSQTDPDTGRKYLTFQDGARSYFPNRLPKTARFTIQDSDPADQYARLYSDAVVDRINKLSLPRYGLANYISPDPEIEPNAAEREILQNLSRAGKRLMGFCRTNLFKRLESSGQAFLLSVQRHALRNIVVLHAIENGLPIPIGAQDALLLDLDIGDEDIDTSADSLYETVADQEYPAVTAEPIHSEAEYRRRAADVYAEYAKKFKRRFQWIRPAFFTLSLPENLLRDGLSLIALLQECGDWNPAGDTKLQTLHDLVAAKHPQSKVIVFTQFADTGRYLCAQLQALGVRSAECVTGSTYDPTMAAWRFSPVSNGKRDQIAPDAEIRVLVATDVLSEGQNLQDCAIVVNYDLPWAIIRLIQRAGRVDRIGQKALDILCYSFLPADGVERIIRLRERVTQRLRENAEVVGTDEAFFEGERAGRQMIDLYNERAGILEDDPDSEVDLSSYAYQIWKNAIDADPSLEKAIPALPPVVYSTRSVECEKCEPELPAQQPLPLQITHVQRSLPLAGPATVGPEGALVYLRTSQDNDALVWIDRAGNSVTESQFAILKAAECSPGTPALPRDPCHHQLVLQGVQQVVREESNLGGQLGRPAGARYKVYNRLKLYAQETTGTLLHSPELLRVIDDLYKFPLRQTAADILNRQLKAGISDQDLVDLGINLRAEDRLCHVHEEGKHHEAQIICSLGLVAPRRAT